MAQLAQLREKATRAETPSRGELTAYDFQWDDPIPEGTFDPNVPAGYTQIDRKTVGLQKAAWLGVGTLPVAGFVAYRRRGVRAIAP